MLSEIINTILKNSFAGEKNHGNNFRRKRTNP